MLSALPSPLVTASDFSEENATLGVGDDQIVCLALALRRCRTEELMCRCECHAGRWIDCDEVRLA